MKYIMKEELLDNLNSSNNYNYYYKHLFIINDLVIDFLISNGYKERHYTPAYIRDHGIFINKELYYINKSCKQYYKSSVYENKRCNIIITVI